MDRVSACEIPDGSLLAGFGGPADYRDCFCREVPGIVSLADYIERFYCSAVFRSERAVLGLLGRGASSADARALAHGETDRIAVWEVIGRRPGDRKGDCPPAGPQGQGRRSADALNNTKTPHEAKHGEEILLLSRGTGTASWLAVEPLEGRTRLLFGSWVGNLEQSGWRFMQRAHQWYSRALLGGA